MGCACTCYDKSKEANDNLKPYCAPTPYETSTSFGTMGQHLQGDERAFLKMVWELQEQYRISPERYDELFDLCWQLKERVAIEKAIRERNLSMFQ